MNAVTGTPTACAVSHAPGYVQGECSGAIRLYRSTVYGSQYWLCDADAPRAIRSGLRVELVEESEEAS